MTYKIKKKITYLYMLVLTIYLILPIIILYIPPLFEYKFYLLVSIGLAIYFLFRGIGVKNEELGIKRKNLVKSLKRNFTVITIFILAIIILNLCDIGKYAPTETILFYAFYTFLSCPLQEFLYRGIFGYFDRQLIKNKHTTALISSFCYSFVHIIYRNFFTCLITFMIGMIWFYMYEKDENLLGVSVSHAVLGVLTIFLGIVD